MNEARKAQLRALVSHPGYEVLMAMLDEMVRAMDERAFTARGQDGIDNFVEARGSRRLAFSLRAGIDALTKSEEVNNAGRD